MLKLYIRKAFNYHIKSLLIQQFIKKILFNIYLINNFLILSDKKDNNYMKEQTYDRQNQSQTDEGFIPSKIIMKQKQEFQLKRQQKKVHTDKQFIPRYISEGIIRQLLDQILRKQPSECYERFSHFDFLQQPNIITNKMQNIYKGMAENFSTRSQNIQDVTIDYNQSSLKRQKSMNQRRQSLTPNHLQRQNSRKQSPSPNKNKNKQKSSTPYDKYVQSGDYILVYNRYKDFKFSNNNPNFASNQVKLDCLKSLDDVKFKPVKPFQIIQQKIQDIFTQAMNRNNSVKQSLLQFDSKFECGNLLCAFKNKKIPYSYDLFIQNDTNTYGYNQWFYFSIKNAQTRIKYNFNIVNFRKRHSFFREGNKPVIFSLLDSRKNGKSGYSKKGQNIVYGRSTIVKSYESKQKFFQLSFDLQFQNQNDVSYISMGLPFSYSKLIHKLNQYESTAKENKLIWKTQTIATTIANNKIPYVTITKKNNHKNQQILDDKQKEEQKQSQNVKSVEQNRNQFFKYQSANLSSQNRNEESSSNQNQSDHACIPKNKTKQGTHKNKKVILFIARQHPGETWSSYLMDQILNQLANQKTQASRFLVQNFTIKCIPMINVDGVIMGNFRCDLTGMDLNRNWKTPSYLLHPQICSIKNQIINLVNKGNKIQSVFDLHGHSKQYNIFCYSCKTDNYQSRLLPYIFHHYNSQFHFPFCTFGISRYKLSTARAVIFEIIKNTNVLTIQSSFFASNSTGNLQIFQPLTFQNMAKTIIKGCKSYFSCDQDYKICKQIINSRINQFLQYRNGTNNAMSGSDSQPSQDQIELKQKMESIIPKNLIQQVIEIQNKKKQNKKVKRNIKRQTLQAPVNRNNFKLKKIQYNSQHKNRTIDIVKDEITIKQTKSNWQPGKKNKRQYQDYNKTNAFKKNSIIMSSQTIQDSQFVGQRRNFYKDLIQKQQYKLPFFTKQKPQLIPLKLKNQSFQIFKDAYNATQKQLKSHAKNDSLVQDIRNQRKSVTRKLGIFKQKNQKEDQFPLLCVLSENKKRTHAQKFKQKVQQNSSTIQQKKYNDDGMTQKFKTTIQTRTQAIKQLRQKSKNSMQLVSKIWRQNFTRYGMAFSTFKISK